MGPRRRRAAASDAVLLRRLPCCRLLQLVSDCNEQCDRCRNYCLQVDVFTTRYAVDLLRCSLACEARQVGETCKMASQLLPTRRKESLQGVERLGFSRGFRAAKKVEFCSAAQLRSLQSDHWQASRPQLPALPFSQPFGTKSSPKTLSQQGCKTLSVPQWPQ